jgi:hypothetical protein
VCSLSQMRLPRAWEGDAMQGVDGGKWIARGDPNVHFLHGELRSELEAAKAARAEERRWSRDRSSHSTSARLT